MPIDGLIQGVPDPTIPATKHGAFGQYSMVLQERFELSRVSPTDPKSVVSAISPLEHVAGDNGIEPLSSVLETEVLPLN